jgi:hypothetical protein
MGTDASAAAITKVAFLVRVMGVSLIVDDRITRHACKQVQASRRCNVL